MALSEAACFIVRDANGQALGSGRIAKLPELSSRVNAYTGRRAAPNCF
jgi:hypothetical protein